MRKVNGLFLHLRTAPSAAGSIFFFFVRAVICYLFSYFCFLFYILPEQEQALFSSAACKSFAQRISLIQELKKKKNKKNPFFVSETCRRRCCPNGKAMRGCWLRRRRRFPFLFCVQLVECCCCLIIYKFLVLLLLLLLLLEKMRALSLSLSHFTCVLEYTIISSTHNLSRSLCSWSTNTQRKRETHKSLKHTREKRARVTHTAGRNSNKTPPSAFLLFFFFFWARMEGKEII